MRFRAVLPVLAILVYAVLLGCGGGGNTGGSSTSLQPISVLDDFTSLGTWTPGGTLSLSSPPVTSLVNTTLASIAYDSGTTGAATITLASNTGVQAGILVTFNRGGSNEEPAVLVAGTAAGTFRVSLINQHSAGEAVQDDAVAASVATGTGFLQNVRPYDLSKISGALTQAADQLLLWVQLDNTSALTSGRILLDIDPSTHDFHTALYADFAASNLPLLSVSVGDLKVLGTNPYSGVINALSHVQGIQIQFTTTATVNAKIDTLWLSRVASDSSQSGVPAKITVAPASVSLALGNVAALTPTALDFQGNAATTSVTFTYTSSNPALVTVSSNGAVCAGRWDANFQVCTPDTTQPNGGVGTAQITVSGAGLTSDPVTVYVHQRVANVTVSPALVDCRSQGQTQQMTARAFDPSGNDITSTVGPFTWAVQDPAIATVDSTVNGLLTASTPGKSTVSATLVGTAGITGTPAVFVTCPVHSISLHTDTGATSVTVDSTATQPVIVADILDTQGNPVSGISLRYVGSVPPVGSVVTGKFIPLAPGTTSINAECLPPDCNAGLTPIYSNVVVVTFTGTVTPKVYAASTTSTSVIPIDTSASPKVAGTAITLPANPTSIGVGPVLSSKIFLGSSAGLLAIGTDNTVATTASATGTLLTVSSDGNNSVTSDLNAGRVFVNTTALNIAGATAAAYTTDVNKLFVVTNTGLLDVISTTSTLKSIPLNTTATDVKPLTSSWLVYLAQPGGFGVRATCDNSARASVAVGGTPRLLAPLPDGERMLGVETRFLDIVRTNSTGSGCPPDGSSFLEARKDSGQDFTPKQLIVLPDGSKAYIITTAGQLLAYDIAANTVSTIDLGGANALSGAATFDSKNLYVGGSDNKIHRVDVAAGADAEQITLTITPDLVVIRP